MPANCTSSVILFSALMSSIWNVPLPSLFIYSVHSVTVLYLNTYLRLIYSTIFVTWLHLVGILSPVSFSVFVTSVSSLV